MLKNGPVFALHALAANRRNPASTNRLLEDRDLDVLMRPLLANKPVFVEEGVTGMIRRGRIR